MSGKKQYTRKAKQTDLVEEELVKVLDKLHRLKDTYRGYLTFIQQAMMYSHWFRIWQAPHKKHPRQGVICKKPMLGLSNANMQNPMPGPSNTNTCGQ